MSFKKINNRTWKNENGAIITSYKSYNSTYYYLTIEGVCCEKQFYKLNEAKKYAKEIN